MTVRHHRHHHHHHRRRQARASRLAAALTVVLLAGAAWFAAAPAASAHALVVASDPAPGATLTRLPKAVTVTFSEKIVPLFSTLRVTNSAGRAVGTGKAHLVPGDELEFAIGLPALLDGVYTVSWTAVSSDDGHASSGSFTFGVGRLAYAASGGPAPALVSTPDALSPGIVAGRWIFDTGLGLLVGGCWIALYGFPPGTRRTLFLALGGAGATLAGLAVTGWAQASTDHVALGELASTSLGLGLLVQAVPSAAAWVCMGVALAPQLRDAQRRTALTAALVCAAAAIAAHVLTTHAAASRHPDLEIAADWIHVAGFATWIGGLAALLLTLGTETSPAKAAAVRRFSQSAALALAVLFLGGVVRALDEVAAWSALVSTLFGRLVLAKVALLACLVALGARNRYRSVPAAASSLGALRRTGAAELGVAALAVLAAAALSSSLPPALVRAVALQPAAPHVLVHGSGPGVRATMDVGPGYPGENVFTLRVYDAATGRAVNPGATLTFSLPARPDVSVSTLDLSAAIDGSLAATGPGLSLTGQWSVTADLTLATGRVEIPFTVPCVLSPGQIEQMTMGRMVMVYGVQLAGGRQLEAYLTPGRAGANALHVVFTDQRNGRVAMSGVPSVTVHRDGQPGTRHPLAMLRIGTSPLTAGDFYAATEFTRGKWDFDLTAHAADGTRLNADFSLTVS
jgi:copper transport protein